MNGKPTPTRLVGSSLLVCAALFLFWSPLLSTPFWQDDFPRPSDLPVSPLVDEADIAIGNVIGSNMFNLLAVLGLPGLIAPGPVDSAVLSRDYPIMISLTLILLVLAYGVRGKGCINRMEGGFLFLCYCAYQSLLYSTAIGAG